MPSPLETLAPEYRNLFASCEILPDGKGHPISLSEVGEFARRLLGGKAKYIEAQTAAKVPWFVVGLIHGMECDFSFKEHLHNGDPLTGRTVQVPSGRPKTGNPPFPWLTSAIDALAYDDFNTWRQWDVPGICFKLEGYNGWGYRKHGINSPYLWSGSNQYVRGKYIADGVWSPDAVSKQVGAITALKYLIETQEIELAPQPA